MAAVVVTTSLDLSDYFSKYGFGDGDDAAALEVGQALRGEAVCFLNEELARAGLELRAHAEDVGTIHNPCQIALRHRTGLEAEVEMEGRDVVVLEDALTEYEGPIDAAWSQAYDRFEELLLIRSPMVTTLRRCTHLARQLAEGKPGAMTEAGAVAEEAEQLLRSLGVAPERAT